MPLSMGSLQIVAACRVVTALNGRPGGSPDVEEAFNLATANVIPAKAGIRSSLKSAHFGRIPACAGTTVRRGGGVSIRR